MEKKLLEIEELKFCDAKVYFTDGQNEYEAVIDSQDLCDCVAENGLNEFVTYTWGYGDCSSDTSHIDPYDYLRSNFEEVVKEYISINGFEYLNAKVLA